MISIISCTNRKESLSFKVALIYKNILISKNQEVEILDLEKLPTDFIFSALYENAGKNSQFNLFQEKMEQSDKFIFIIPEYNGSFPGVIKSFIDGLSYPSPLQNKIVGLVGISSGGQGATLALSHMTDILHYLNCDVLSVKPKCIMIESKLINSKIEDKTFNELLINQAQALIEFN